MSRTVIAAVVAAVIAGLTAIAYFVTSKSFENAAFNRADEQLERAYQVLQRVTQLQAIDVSSKAERLAALPEFVAAIKSSGDDRRRQASIGFLKFVSSDKAAVKPDIIALVDKNGELLAMHEVPGVVPKQWQNAKGESVLPALNVVLKRRTIISDIWDYGEKGMMQIGVAPVIDPDAQISAENADGVVISGAIVVAYAQTAKNAQLDRGLLGTEIAYVDGKRVVASSFTRGEGGDEDTARARALGQLLQSGKLNAEGSKQRITIGDTDYLAAAVKMARKSTSTKDLPADYPPVTARALAMSPISSAGSNVGTVKLFILLVGAGSLAIAMLGIYLTHRRVMAQVDQVEQGVTDIINGNVDRTFRPVGEELDGLANGLNVMLARLLGRPEPGEEEFDDDGNPIIPGRVEFDEGEAGASAPAVDPDIAALAQESEPDYYKRIYTEYLAAKRASGKPDDVSFENFIAKLKVNEGKLKAQYQCRAVRFRVVTKDGKVTLKPVPIFA